MIRTLEAACNNNILHPVLLHKPFLSLIKPFYTDVFYLHSLGVISISFGVNSQGYGVNSKDLRR